MGLEYEFWYASSYIHAEADMQDKANVLFPAPVWEKTAFLVATASTKHGQGLRASPYANYQDKETENPYKNPAKGTTFFYLHQLTFVF